jgi:hypothetical protein
MKKSGYYFIEGKPRYGFPPPGTTAPDEWEPYKLWSGDLWQCMGCGHRLVSGAGFAPIAEHYQEGFDKTVSAFAPQLTVNDC